MSLWLCDVRVSSWWRGEISASRRRSGRCWDDFPVTGGSERRGRCQTVPVSDPFIQRRPSITDGEALRQAIRSRGYTIADFAKVAGVHPQTIRDWISGRRATQLRVEWRVRWTLRQLPIMFGDVPGEDPFGDRVVPLPPAAAAALGPGILRPPASDPGPLMVRRPPRAALVTTDTGLADFQAALLAVPPLEAWQTYGYRVVSSGRAGAAFRRALQERRPWDAFPGLGDREYWRTVHSAMTLLAPPLWP